MNFMEEHYFSVCKGRKWICVSKYYELGATDYIILISV